MDAGRPELTEWITLALLLAFWSAALGFLALRRLRGWTQMKEQSNDLFEQSSFRFSAVSASICEICVHLRPLLIY